MVYEPTARLPSASISSVRSRQLTLRAKAMRVLDRLGVVGVSMLVSVMFASATAAQERRDTTRADTSIFRIGEIVVQAARPVTTVGGASAIEVLLDSLALPAAPTLEAVLRQVPTIHVRTNSRGESEITMRGSESRQVAVLVDGVPLTLGWDARTDVSVVPATAPQELTLIRGLSSVLYGPNTLGGIVEVGVGRGVMRAQAHSLQLTAGVDHVGGYASSATVTLPFESSSGRWLVRGGVGYRNLPGVPLASGVVEPVPGSDEDLRLNTDLDHTDGFAALRYTADGGTWFAFSSSAFRAERGIAAELGASSPRFWRYPDVARVIAVASGGTGERRTPFGGQGDIEASLGIDLGQSEIHSFQNRAYDRVVGSEKGDDRTYTLRLLADHTLGTRADLRAAFTYADINRDQVTDSGPTAEYRQRLWSVGAESVVRLLESGSGTLENMRVSFGAVLDRGDTPESADKPPLDALTDWGARLGVTAAFAGGDALLHAGASRRARFPALRELYSDALRRFEPNPTLTAERLIAMEAGITTRVASGEVQAVIFHHRLNDAIVRITTAEGRFQRINRDQIRSTGLELLGGYAFGALSVGGDLSLQSVELIDPNAGASREPENQPAIFGSLNARFPLVAGLRGIAEARYTGRQFCVDLDSGGDRRLDAGTHLNAELAREWRLRPTGAPWLSRLETRASVDNIRDTAIYDQCGLPQAGRLLRFQLRLF